MYNQKEIAKELNVSVGTVTEHRKKLGIEGFTVALKRVRGGSLKELQVSEEEYLQIKSSVESNRLKDKDRKEKQCTKCLQTLPIDNFYVRGESTRTKGSRTSSCITCHKERTNHYRSNPPLSYKMQLLLPQGKRANKIEKENLPCSITREELMEKWAHQEGKCYYSGLEMTLVPGRYTVSLDRIIPELGYTKDNTVLCLDIINRMKLDSTVEEFINLCDSVRILAGR